jgi:sugar phosphate isomerase/epimerase
MMRLCCLSLSFKPDFAAGRMDDLRFIERCAALELDGVDFNLNSLHALDPDHLRKVKRACVRHGLTIACVGVSNDFGRPAGEQEMVQRQIRQGIDTAQFLGAPLVRLFAGRVAPGANRDAIWQRTVAGLRRAAEAGERAGVVVALQNHNHGNVAATGEDVTRLLKEVDHPWCTHILDTGQYLGSRGASGARPEDPRRHDVYRSIAQTAPLAVFVRAKLYRLRSGKEEWLDYDRIFQTLRAAKYNGFVCLVYEGWADQPTDQAVPAGVKFLRSYLTDGRR